MSFSRTASFAARGHNIGIPILSSHADAFSAFSSTPLSPFTLTSRALVSRSRSLPGSDAIPPRLIYRRIRRGHSFAMSALAGTQASFWGYTAYLSQQVPDPLLSPAWTLAGLGLSTVFAGMVHFYLKRTVAELSIVDGSSQRLRVKTHAFGGRVSIPKDFALESIVGGPKKDDAGERYWTFAVRRDDGGIALHYIVDTSKGVIDLPAVAALARGGEHVLALAHRRRAEEMRGRWKEWEAEQESRTR